MLRRLFTLVSAASLALCVATCVLCVATCVLWVRGLTAFDWVTWGHAGPLTSGHRVWRGRRLRGVGPARG